MILIKILIIIRTRVQKQQYHIVSTSKIR